MIGAWIGVLTRFGGRSPLSGCEVGRARSHYGGTVAIDRSIQPMARVSCAAVAGDRAVLFRLMLHAVAVIGKPSAPSIARDSRNGHAANSSSTLRHNGASLHLLDANLIRKNLTALPSVAAASSPTASSDIFAINVASILRLVLCVIMRSIWKMERPLCNSPCRSIGSFRAACGHRLSQLRARLRKRRDR
jgi:hypothetical protein